MLSSHAGHVGWPGARELSVKVAVLTLRSAAHRCPASPSPDLCKHHTCQLCRPDGLCLESPWFTDGASPAKRLSWPRCQAQQLHRPHSSAEKVGALSPAADEEGNRRLEAHVSVHFLLVQLPSPSLLSELFTFSHVLGSHSASRETQTETLLLRKCLCNSPPLPQITSSSGLCYLGPGHHLLPRQSQESSSVCLQCLRDFSFLTSLNPCLLSSPLHDLS